MKPNTIVLFILMLAFTLLSFAQQQPEKPTPPPELKRLDYFMGTWTTEGEMKPGLFGPGGKITGKDRFEWFPGGFFLVMHSEGKGPMGDIKGLAVFGYDAQNKVYTYNGFSSTGDVESFKGTVQGKTWTWTSEFKIAEKKVKGRFILSEASPTSATMKYEVSEDGGPWKIAMEGKQTKVK